jgi:uncharacterized damage-inducible protein DinB
MTTMKKLEWFERQFTFGLPEGMLPFYLERLGGTLARIEQKVSGIPEPVLSDKLDGKWSVKENIAHLAEVDEIALKRIDEMKQGISPMSPAVIQPGRDYNAQPIAEVLRFFKTNRDKNLQKYRGLTAEDLKRSSLHPRLKVQMTAVDLAWFDAEHDDHHLVRVNEILKTLLK